MVEGLVVIRAIDPSIGAVAEARARAPWPVEAATIATAWILVVTHTTIAEVAGAIDGSTAMVQGRTQRHNTVQGSGSVGSMEVGSMARIPWEVASTAEIASHGGRCGERVG